jgi:hypothetical protein
MAITPINIDQSIDACHHWLSIQHNKNWLLFFDNADDVQLNLGEFFPVCSFGNILITTRNPQLKSHADMGADAKVADMNPHDAKCLLMQTSWTEKSDENERLAALIVKVNCIYYSFTVIFKLIVGIESPLFCIGHLSGRCLYSSLLFTQTVFGTLSRSS